MTTWTPSDCRILDALERYRDKEADLIRTLKRIKAAVADDWLPLDQFAERYAKPRPRTVYDLRSKRDPRAMRATKKTGRIILVSPSRWFGLLDAEL